MLLLGAASQAQEEQPQQQPAPEQQAQPAQPEQPQARTVTGTVTDSLTREGIYDVRVSVKGTNVFTMTDVEGNFTLQNVPLGQVTLRVFSASGHDPKDVVVGPDQGAVKVTLGLSYTEELVVVGRATEVARKNLANAVASVNSQDLARAPAQTMDQALSGKVAGANIQSNSGAPGGGIQMRMRGVSTIIGNSAPLYVIDGVLVSDVAIASGVFAVTASGAGSNNSATQDNQVNRIADINPNDIENIEVLKGASAAAIYGSKASNGVVIITTKRGRPGSEPKLDFTQRVGMYQLANKLGARRFETEEEAVATFGPQAASHFQPGVAYDQEQLLAGRSAPSTETALGLSGSTENGKTRYYASGLVKNDEGIIQNSGYSKEALRMNLSHRFGERVEVNVASNLLHSLSKRGLTNNDNAGVSYHMVLPFTPSFLDLRQRQDGTYPANPFIGSLANPLQTAALMTNNEDVWRLLGSADTSISLFKTDTQELKLLGNIGVDRFQQKNELLFPPELHFEPVDDGYIGTSLFTTSEVRALNGGVNLIHSYRPTSGVFTLLNTSAGFQYEERDRSSVYIVSRNLNAGQSNVDAGTRVGVSEYRELVRDRGFYLQEEAILLDERLTLVGAVRGEQSSNNGNPNALFFYPKAAAAYRLPGLPKGLEEVKVRAAYGETGNQPSYSMKFTALTTTNNIGGGPGIIIGPTVGDPNIRPERQREIELGVDTVAFDGRAVLELTLYQRTISDLLLRRTLPPSTGFTTAILNGGELRNLGMELMLQLTPVRTESFQWVSRTTFALNRSQITDLPVPDFLTGGFGTSLGAFRIEKGASATQIVGNDGLKPDGTCCVVRKVGDTEPIFRMGFANNLSWRGFTLSSLFDWQLGSSIINLTKFLYDLGGNTADFDTPIPGETVTVGQKRLNDQPTFAKVYIEDASFLKLRELTLSYELPSAWVRKTVPAAQTARLSISGRNLFTLSPYTGLDPEVSNFGNQPIARNIDVAPFPPSRSYWVSLDVGF